MRSRKTSITNQGSILVELSIALAVFALMIPTLSLWILNRQQHATSLQTERIALFGALSNLEVARTSPSGISTSTLKDSISFTLDSSALTPCIQNFSSRSSWMDGTRTKSFYFSTLSFNADSAQALGRDCEGTYVPLSLSATSSPPTLSLFTPQGTTTAFDVLNNVITFSQNLGPTTTLQFIKKDRYPTFISLSSVNLNSTISALDGIKDFVFLAGSLGHDQLQVVSTQNIFHPLLTSSLSLPGVAGSFPGATSIRYFNQKIYIGTHRTAGRELHIYAFSTSSPLWLGSIELNHNINMIAIKEPYAFLATSGNTKDLIILNIHDPKSIQQISSLALPGTEDAISLALIGDTLYMGRKRSLKPSEPDFIAISIADPNNPKVIAARILQKDVIGIRVYDTLVFLATKTSTSSVNILSRFDLTDIQKYSVSGTMLDLDYEKNTLSILGNTSIMNLTF